ncbi:Programmed cell death protein 5 [Holothuria leucospilota]|uniref:Programmed cell death protein 5 n=1 Tax=Holothuria leucospilota TaxID=206669 RepID=A0A9Q1C8Z5_HOLLE|nr:Programmed cell death protein 5 [Holothuria leucospilota]
MDQDELAAIRAKRMAELQQQMGGGGNEAQQKQQQEAQARQEEMKNSILAQVLDQSARARLNSIALVKPEKAKMIEGMLCQMATTGQLPGKYERRRVMDSDDEDDY